MKRQKLVALLPTLGIFAFALASVWSLYQLFNNSALHPTALYWIPAALVELVTAWLAFQSVEAARQITRSNISKQDKKFAKLIFCLCISLAVPTFIVSFSANFYEFRGSIGLASLFPISCIACAVASAIPHIKTQAADTKVVEERDKAQRLRETVQVLEQRCAELEQSRTMKEAGPDDYVRICAGLNGNKPTKAREVNRLLQDNGYYALADSTAKSWVK